MWTYPIKGQQRRWNDTPPKPKTVRMEVTEVGTFAIRREAALSGGKVFVVYDAHSGKYHGAAPTVRAAEMVMRSLIEARVRARQEILKGIQALEEVKDVA